MKNYKVTFLREYYEYGEVEVEAESEDEAREVAEDMESSDDQSIEWGEMTHECGTVDSIEQLD